MYNAKLSSIKKEKKKKGWKKNLKNWGQRVPEEGQDGERDPADLISPAAMIIICKLKRTFPGAQCLHVESKEMVLWSYKKNGENFLPTRRWVNVK